MTGNMTSVCSNLVLSRPEWLHYIAANAMYLFVIGADVISIIFGCYLYVCAAGFQFALE